MVALTKDRDTPRKHGELFSPGVAADVKIFLGSLVVLNVEGYAQPGTTATGLVALGRAESSVDNTGGVNGEVDAPVRSGVFRFENSAGGDLVSIANVGDDCFIVDDQTVALTNGGGTRSVAGTITDVDADGVWVRVGI